MKIKLEDSIVLVVDIQERLLPAMSDSDKVLENNLTFLRGITTLEVPVVYTEQYPKGLGKTVDPVLNVIPEAKYFEKIQFSSLEEEVCTYLKESGRNTVLVCGIESHVCVLQTIMDLVEAGFKPVLISDCTSSRKESDKTYAIVRAGAEGAIISSYESVLFELMKTAKHPKFREISKIVK